MKTTTIVRAYVIFQSVPQLKCLYHLSVAESAIHVDKDGWSGPEMLLNVGFNSQQDVRNGIPT